MEEGIHAFCEILYLLKGYNKPRELLFFFLCRLVVKLLGFINGL